MPEFLEAWPRPKALVFEHTFVICHIYVIFMSYLCGRHFISNKVNRESISHSGWIGEAVIAQPQHKLWVQAWKIGYLLVGQSRSYLFLFWFFSGRLGS